MKHKNGYLLLVLFFCAFQEVVAMGMFPEKEEEVVLCSPIEGRLTYKGQPVKGARIERLLIWKDDVGEKDYANSDEEGRFQLPLKEASLAVSPLAQFVVAQEIVVLYDGEEYPIWVKAKREKGIYEELDGKPTNLICELTDDLKTVRQGRGTFATSCRWDSIENYKE
jgi:hypothetical protein